MYRIEFFAGNSAFILAYSPFEMQAKSQSPTDAQHFRRTECPDVPLLR